MNRHKIILLTIVLSLAACRAAAPPAGPRGPQRLGAIVPFGQTTYPRAFYNTTAPTPSNGDSVNLQSDSAGSLMVGTPGHTADTSFHMDAAGLGVWLNSGGAVATDSSPNSVSPSAGRIIRVSARPGAMLNAGSATLFVYVLDGTSLAVVPWLFDDTLNLWVQIGASITVTAANGRQLIVSTMGNLVGAKVFVQVTTNTGTVTKAGYSIN